MMNDGLIDRVVQKNGERVNFQVFDPQTNKKLYADKLGELWNHILSSNPDSCPTDPKSTVFLRTSPDYKSSGPHRQDLKIGPEQPIFLTLGDVEIDKYDLIAQRLDPATNKLDVAKADIDAGKKGKNIANIENKPIVDNIDDYLVQNPKFELKVDNDSPVKDKLEVKLPGDVKLDACAMGYCIYIKSLPVRDDHYTIHIYSQGADNYESGALYKITVGDTDN
jgi:hypothetical protein